MSTIKKTVLLLIAILALSACTTSWQQLKDVSEKAYPNQEWRRPPAHWSPP